MEHVQRVLSVVESGSEEALRGLLREGGKVDVCDEEGSSSLLYAAAHGWEDIVRMLLKNKVDVNATNLYGWTALMQAACYGHLPSVKLLLQMGAKVNLTNRWGASALVGAAQGGFLTVVQVLLEEGAEVNKEEEVKSLTALMAASQCGHDAIVTQLTSCGSLVNAHLKTTKWTAIMLAVLNNQLSTVKLLLQHGADREARDVNGRRAAELAAVLGHEDIQRLLAGEKQQQDKYKLSDNEFFDAVKSGEVKKVGEMLSQKPSLAHITDRDGATPLMFAANKGHVEICKALLGAGAEVNAKDKVHQWTPLMQATHQRSYAVVRLLGEHGADVNHRGKNGLTAFEIATVIADVEMIQIVANISMERIQQQGSTTMPTPAMPTPATPTTDLSTKETDVGEKPNKSQMPDVARRLTKEADGPLDPTVLIKRLRNAYHTPDNVPVVFSTDGQPASPAPGGPMTRHQNYSRLNSTPASLNVSLEKTSDHSSASSTTGAPFTKPSPSSFHVGGAPRTNRGMLGPGGANHKGSVLDKFLSKSNPSEGGGRWKGGGGGRLQQGKLGHAAISMPNGSQLRKPKSGKPGGVSGGRDSVPSFLPKLPQLGSRLENHHPPRQISNPGTLPKRRPVPRLRNRSYTDPLDAFRPDVGPKKSFLKQLEPLPALDLRFALEEASLSHYHSVFLEQEVDYHSFVTLGDEDLQEMGITSKTDREKLLSVIARLNTKSETSHGGTNSASKPGTPVFVFQ